MPSEFPMNDPRDIWQEQPTEVCKMSAAELRLKAQKFEKRISRRNLREYVASAIVIAGFGWYIWLFPSTLTRTGCVLIIAATLFAMYTLHKSGGARTMPADLAFRSCVEFHRQELQRQRDLVRGVWWWALLPLFLGLIVFSLGRLQEQALMKPNASAHSGAIVINLVLGMVVPALMFVGLWWLNHRAANRLQLRINALDALEKES
jgi:hypothetical protein